MIVGGDETKIGKGGQIKVVYMGQNAKQYSTFQSKVVTSPTDNKVMKAISLDNIIRDNDRLYGE